MTDPQPLTDTEIEHHLAMRRPRLWLVRTPSGELHGYVRRVAVNREAIDVLDLLRTARAERDALRSDVAKLRGAIADMAIDRAEVAARAALDSTSEAGQ